MQSEGVVDVDAIPSSINEPMIPTMVEEQELAPVTGQMEIDPHSKAWEKNLTQQHNMETVQPTNEEDEE
jgi:hypothetical protein